jgi:hypothetical protein
MVSENYAKAYKEIIEILKYTKKSDVKKIPKEKIILWQNNMDKTWDFTVDTNKTLEEQNILDETRAIIANIFYDYWATDYQKQRIDEKDKKNAEIQEIQKREKYNPDNIFKNKQVEEVSNISDENYSLTVIKEDGWYKKILLAIKNFFSKNNQSNNMFSDKDIKKIENNKSNGTPYAKLADKEYKKMTSEEKKQYKKTMKELSKKFK